MTNRDIAGILFNISSILNRQHGNPYRIRAYRRAARFLLRMREPVAQRLAAGKPLGIPRLGKSLTAKISALATDNRLAFYDELCEELSPDEARLLHVPGIGPAIASRIVADVGSTEPDNLRRAAATGKLQRVWGVGPKRTAVILNTLCPPLVRQEALAL
ncbi:MAG: helix-hairpin-helix domain-containing protein [Chloroflexaceae bacterium]|jgi:DNA polymerase (family 10)|nr:helix-hairpin-helix domain-containing protein [Chloroflexaceae bacterium]